MEGGGVVMAEEGKLTTTPASTLHSQPSTHYSGFQPCSDVPSFAPHGDEDGREPHNTTEGA